MKTIIILLFTLNIIFVVLLVAFLGLYRFAIEVHKKEGVALRNCLFLQKWLRKENLNHGFLVQKLTMLGCNRIYIYGAGIMGIQLYYAIANTDIEIIGFIDRSANEVGVNIPIYRIDKVDYSEADSVVVTLTKGANGIIDEIRKYATINVILLDDLI